MTDMSAEDWEAAYRHAATERDRFKHALEVIADTTHPEGTPIYARLVLEQSAPVRTYSPFKKRLPEGQ